MFTLGKRFLQASSIGVLTFIVSVAFAEPKSDEGNILQPTDDEGSMYSLMTYGGLISNGSHAGINLGYDFNIASRTRIHSIYGTLYVHNTGGCWINACESPGSSVTASTARELGYAYGFINPKQFGSVYGQVGAGLGEFERYKTQYSETPAYYDDPIANETKQYAITAHVLIRGGAQLELGVVGLGIEGYTKTNLHEITAGFNIRLGYGKFWY